MTMSVVIRIREDGSLSPDFQPLFFQSVSSLYFLSNLTRQLPIGCLPSHQAKLARFLTAQKLRSSKVHFRYCGHGDV